MNNKGFTLVELLAVIVLLSLTMLLIFPSVRSIYSSNQNKQYETYEDMMIKYVKVIPKYKEKSYICLRDLGMKKINDNISCNGYVDISNMKSYITCKNTSKEVYKTNGINDNILSNCSYY